MVDSPSAMKNTFSAPEIKPLDQYDSNRAKICASVGWLLSKSHGGAENVPAELREPLYKDQYDQEHLKPSVSKLLLCSDTYCQAQGRLAQANGVPPPTSQNSPSDYSSLLQLLVKKGLCPKVLDEPVTEEELCKNPVNTKAHLALIDSLMSLAGRETVGQVKIAAEAEQMGVGAPWENALLFWVNRLTQKLREMTEEEEPPKPQTCTDLQPVQDRSQSNRWYWKLVPHAIAFCLKESGNKPPVIRYKKDKVQSKLTPTFPLVSAVKDLSNGCAIAAVLYYYCPSQLPLDDVCLKDTMSVADSVHNLHLIKEFCDGKLQGCCPLAVEDLLYAPPPLHLNILSFIADLLEWFEIKKPDFVKPIQPVDLTDISGLLDCTSPVNGNSNSNSPAFILKQPFVPLPSSTSQDSKSWTKKQISRPLSAVTFSIPFGLDSDVDIVMGNPIDSVFRSVSSDNLTAGIPATDSSSTPTGMTRVPYSPPEDLSHLVSASAPSQRFAWSSQGARGELPTIEEALQAVHTLGGKERKKARTAEKRAKTESRTEPRLRPEGAPAGFFLHCPGEEKALLSSSAPGRSGVPHWSAEAADNERRARRGRSGQNADMSRDDDSVLRDGSIDSSEASDDTPRNAPGNIRPASGRPGNHSASGSPRMTSFAERRDHRRRNPGDDSASSPNPTTPGSPFTPNAPFAQQNSLGPKGPEPGSDACELAARLEEKRKSIESQKKRIEAIFAKHRQRLGKTAFLQLKREQGEEGAEGGAAEVDSVSLEERLTRMEEHLKQEEEKDDGKAAEPTPPRLEKQVTFSIESKKGAEQEKGAGKAGESVIVEYNEVVQKLSDALQSLQKDMQKLTEQQQQLMSNQQPRNTSRAPLKSTAPSSTRTPPRTPPHTPTKTPPRTPTRTPTRSTSRAWAIPAGTKSPASSPSQRSRLLSSANTPKLVISSSCPAPGAKLSSLSTPRSPKHTTRPKLQVQQRPSELKFPPLNRVLTPTHNVDTIPHLRRVSPSKCQVQTSSSFRIGGPQTPQQVPQPPAQPDETSDTGSSETPTQFSLELEQDDVEPVGGLPVLSQSRLQRRRRPAGGSSSGAPSECSFESDTLSLSAAYSTEAETGEGDAGRPCEMNEASLSTAGGADGVSDEPTDEGQEFSSDSMSDHMDSARAPAADLLGLIQEPDLTTDQSSPPQEAVPREEAEARGSDIEPPDSLEPDGDQSEMGPKGGVGFFFQDETHSEGEMAQRKALLLERQQRRAEELRRRRQWNEQERQNRSASADGKISSPCNTPPRSTTSTSPTPPATPGRRGGFTRAEYERRHQLKIMDDLEKALRQKTTNQNQSSAKKARPRPRSATREQTRLSLSPARGDILKMEADKQGSALKKGSSHSSLNLPTTEEPGNSGGRPTKTAQNHCPDSPSRSSKLSKALNPTEDKHPESSSTGTSPAPEYSGPKLFKEPSFKSNKFIIHNALSRCCLAGKVNETQKNKIVEEMEKSSANHFLILFRDSSCQFRGVYTMSSDSQDLVRLTGVGPRTISSNQVEAIYKYSSDRKQFSAIPSKTVGMTVDAFTIPSHLWQGGAAGGGAGGAGGSRRASINKKVAVVK